MGFGGAYPEWVSVLLACADWGDCVVCGNGLSTTPTFRCIAAASGTHIGDSPCTEWLLSWCRICLHTLKGIGETAHPVLSYSWQMVDPPVCFVQQPNCNTELPIRHSFFIRFCNTSIVIQHIAVLSIYPNTWQRAKKRSACPPYGKGSRFPINGCAILFKHLWVIRQSFNGTLLHKCTHVKISTAEYF